MLKRISIQNFRSIRDQTLDLGRLNVFIGANGAGKSNLVEVFNFLREVINENLASYTAKKGGADNLLYLGRKMSPHMKIKVEFSKEENISNSYELKVEGTDEDKFVISEGVFYHEKNAYKGPFDWPVSHCVKESLLKNEDHISARQTFEYLKSYQLYHFHDTSDTAAVKRSCDLEDNRFLRPHGENLAAFLYWMQEREPGHFRNIEEMVRRVAPFFDGFRLAPSRLNEGRIQLEWKERGSDAYFNASALSDGSLRFICLATLLLQPSLPRLVLLDEPELGLHPAAVVILSGLLEAASVRTQLIVATQSVTLINQYGTEPVWVVERRDGESIFRRLGEKDMETWPDGYALGELWEMNALGGRP